MVAEAEPSIEDRVRVLEHNVTQLALGLSHAREWLIMLGSSTTAAIEQLRELEQQSLEAIEEVRRHLGGQ